MPLAHRERRGIGRGLPGRKDVLVQGPKVPGQQPNLGDVLPFLPVPYAPFRTRRNLALGYEPGLRSCHSSSSAAPDSVTPGKTGRHRSPAVSQHPFSTSTELLEPLLRPPSFGTS